jgi:hypothetical protein
LRSDALTEQRQIGFEPGHDPSDRSCLAILSGLSVEQGIFGCCVAKQIARHEIDSDLDRPVDRNQLIAQFPTPRGRYGRLPSIISLATSMASSGEKLSMPPVVIDSTSFSGMKILIRRPSTRRTRARHLWGDVSSGSI